MIPLKPSAREYIRRYRAVVKMAGEFDEGWRLRFEIALIIHGFRIMSLITLSSTPPPKYGKEFYPNGEPKLVPSFPKHLQVAGKLNPHYKDDESVQWNPYIEYERKIVAAAMRGKDGFVIACIRHGDMIFKSGYLSSVNPENYRGLHGSNQGFIDNRGMYLDRKSAFIVAKKTGQLDNLGSDLQHLLQVKELYSEMVY